MKPLLHMTHRKADPDSFAGVLWGVKVFGGYSLIDNPDLPTRNLIEFLKFRENFSWNHKLVIIYDTNRSSALPFRPERFIIIDHHDSVEEELLLEAERVIKKPRASLSMNLYDISKECGVSLPEDVLFSFAVALTIDTAFLRTARSEELEYLSYFLNGRRMEDVYRIVLKGKIKNLRKFIEDLKSLEILDKERRICLLRFSEDDHFFFFVDTFMYSLDCEIVVGKMDWGTWVYSIKELTSKVFSIAKRLGGKGIGKIPNFHNVQKLIEMLKNL